MSNGTAFALGDGLMPPDQDTSWSWVAIAASLSGIASYAAGILTKGWSAARASGASEGEMRVWRTSMEARFADIAAQSAAMEARFNLQISALVVRKDRTDDLLRNVPNREEMNERFDQMSRQIEKITEYMRHDPWTGPSRPIT